MTRTAPRQGWCIATRPRAAEAAFGLPGLLPVLLSPRDSGAGQGRRFAGRGARRGAKIYRRAAGNFRGDPDGRRSAGGFASAAARGRERLADRPRKTAAGAYARPDGRARACHAGAAGALRASGKALYVALHVNHARELHEGAREAIARLRAAGAALLSQTVLLKGVKTTRTRWRRLCGRSCRLA